MKKVITIVSIVLMVPITIIGVSMLVINNMLSGVNNSGNLE